MVSAYSMSGHTVGRTGSKPRPFRCKGEALGRELVGQSVREFGLREAPVFFFEFRKKGPRDGRGLHELLRVGLVRQQKS